MDVFGNRLLPIVFRFLEEVQKGNEVLVKQQINIVWLKRDIRTQDHAPLQAAEDAGIPYRIIFLFEPDLITHPDTSIRHLQFQYHSLLDFNQRLKPFYRGANIFHANAVQVFKHLLANHEVKNVFSYQESGVQLTWNRDKAVAELLSGNGADWKEFQVNGVVRGIKNRDGWDKQWYVTINQPQIQNQFSKNKLEPFENPFPIDAELEKQLQEYPAQFQPAGETNAWRYLKSFVSGRGKSYNRHISKPTESRTSCGRISPYLAWGNISIKQAVQFIVESDRKGFHGILTRLKWHCHFIQKFEVECEYETLCINRGYELLERPEKPDFIQAWKQGKTGYPLVDACMRCVAETGWINFRMRAMVVSFLCLQKFRCAEAPDVTAGPQLPVDCTTPANARESDAPLANARKSDGAQADGATVFQQDVSATPTGHGRFASPKPSKKRRQEVVDVPACAMNDDNSPEIAKPPAKERAKERGAGEGAAKGGPVMGGRRSIR